MNWRERGAIDVETFNGRVELRLPESASGSIDFETVNDQAATIRSREPQQERHCDGACSQVQEPAAWKCHDGVLCFVPKTLRGLSRLDVGQPDQLAPLLGLVDEELPEFGRQQRERCRKQRGQHRVNGVHRPRRRGTDARARRRASPSA